MTKARPEAGFDERVERDARLVDLRLSAWWEASEAGSRRLHEAVGYSLLGGGKRLRALVCLWAAEAAGARRDAALWSAAMAIEMIHCYSLIHDDLPAMDDDDLRRGRASCHRHFDEATAILAGDVLQAEAFLLLAGLADAELARDLVGILAKAAGLEGMVGGQQLDLDLAAAGKTITWERIERLHRWKTGRLLGAALCMGARVAGLDANRLEAARASGESAGLAFQIVDDILDETASSEALGKSAGKDRAQGKATAPRVLGSIDAARAQADHCLEAALSGLETAGVNSAELRSLLRHFVERQA
jgi:geranylgeranyl pyrophosphate synthase